MYTIRASSWPTLFDCGLKWYYDNVVKLKLPSGTAARIGTAVHTGTAAWDSGSDRFSAADQAQLAFLNPEDEVEDIGMAERDSALITVAKMTQSYAITFGRREYALIETAIDNCIVSTQYGDIAITGHVDRITHSGMACDVKTGAARLGRDGKVNVGADHLQIGIYGLMARASCGSIISDNVSIIGGSSSTYEWSEHVVLDAIGMMIGTNGDDGIVSIAAKMIYSGVFPPNPRSMLCSAKYCAAFAHKRCKYHGK